ncbi:unnamed protein product [Caenorhabditis angaria]|uniref:AAA+ ATPase domain-containing protein n=1 Tax=Caenorhabditis angaria TaxID=860376 RepID=A0A9P1I813_9PELO|nr:unnamed protein product [Caenorhabditis angaria]
MNRVILSTKKQILKPLIKRHVSTTVTSQKLQRGKGEDRRVLHTKKITKRNVTSFEILPYHHRGADGSFNKNEDQILYPKEIVEHLNKYVVGQAEAKKCLAVAVYQHYKRVENNMRVSETWFLQDAVEAAKEAKKMKSKDKEGYLDDELPHSSYTNPTHKSQRQILADLEKREDILLEKSNMILLGASGTGKTYITQKLAAILDVPIVICDCTTLTQAGYVGDDVDTVIQKLLAEAHGDVEKCQRGIVFLDEFDKIYTSSDPLHTAGNRDVSGKGVQQALLKLVEGTMVKVRDPLAPNSKIAIDTTNILFVASGAFSNIEHVIARRMDKRTLGFSAQTMRSGADASSSEQLRDEDELIAAKARDELVKQCDQGDLISFGMIPELVGRFPMIVPFHCLDRNQLVSVLSEPKGSLVAQTKKFFENENVELRFSQQALEKIADLAVKRRTGARALKSIVEKAVVNAKYEIPGSNVKIVEINEKSLDDSSFCVIEKKEKNCENTKDD